VNRPEPTKDLAIILRSVAYEDRHRIVTAITERHGQVSALARNSIQSRRFGGTLDPFVASEWMFVQKPGSELAQLNEAVAKRAFEGIRKDFEKLSLASVFSEFMLRISPKNEVCHDLFRLHSNALAALEELPEGPDLQRSLLLLLNGYLAKSLQWSGSQPQLQACSRCQRKLDTLEPDASVTCLISSAAWLCPGCRVADTQHIRGHGTQGFKAVQLRTSPMSLVDFLMSLVSPIRQIPSHAQASFAEHKELFKWIEALLIYHVPGFDQQPLNGLRFLGLESNLQPR